MTNSDAKILAKDHPRDMNIFNHAAHPRSTTGSAIFKGDDFQAFKRSCASATSTSTLISSPPSSAGIDYNDIDDDDYDADTEDKGSTMPPATKRQQQQQQDSANSQIRLPINLFLYGTLADPHVLAYFARLPSLPVLVDASISGFKLMRWGGDTTTPTDTDGDSNSNINIAEGVVHHHHHHHHTGHPTVVPGSRDTDVVHGKIWVCHTVERFRLLQRYKTSMYAHTPCDIEVHNGHAVGRILPGRTFCWPASRDIQGLQPVKSAGGRWDLTEYRRSETYRMIREATIWVDTAGTEVRRLERGPHNPLRLPLYGS